MKGFLLGTLILAVAGKLLQNGTVDKLAGGGNAVVHAFARVLSGDVAGIGNHADKSTTKYRTSSGSASDTSGVWV